MKSEVGGTFGVCEYMQYAYWRHLEGIKKKMEWIRMIWGNDDKNLKRIQQKSYRGVCNFDFSPFFTKLYSDIDFGGRSGNYEIIPIKC